MSNLVEFCLYVLHRIFLSYYLLLRLFPFKLINKKPTKESVQLKKKPRHLLLKMAYSRDTEEIWEDCVQVALSDGIEYLTIIGSPNSRTSGFNGCDIYENHRWLHKGTSSAPRLSINFITTDQQQFYVDQLRRLAALPDFKFDAINLLSSMSPFPQVDLIISTLPKMTFAGCLPTQIGFAEICHLPGEKVNRKTLERALTGYSCCRQNFGK